MTDRRTPDGSSAPDDLPANIGRFAIADVLGSGGMGVVLSAHDPILDRKVAIKILRPDRSCDARRAARLLREARAMARLSHGNVVTVHEAGMFEGRVYIAMELVAGQTLRAWAQGRSSREILRAYLAAGRGLAAAHAAGLVHRDFKPDNVLVAEDGRVLVTDFGLVAPGELDGGDAGDATAPLTTTGMTMGTPSYMSPEQHERRPASASSDQFAFCVALYESLENARPFAGATAKQLREQVLAGSLRPASMMPSWLWPVLCRGLQREPGDRFASMQALLRALEQDPVPRRRRRLVVAGVVVAAAAAGAAAVGVLGKRPAAGPPCAEQSLAVTSLWSPAQRAQVHATFTASDQPFAEDAWRAVAAAFDRFASAWAAMHRDVCELTRVRHEQSDELYDLRMACLQRKLGEARGVMAALVRLDRGTVDRATLLADTLPPLDACADAVALRAAAPAPEDPAARATIASVRQDLALASALRVAGRYREGLEVASAARAQASRQNWPPLAAEAAYVTATLVVEVDGARAAVGLMNDAIDLAGKAHADEILVRAQIKQAWIDAYRLNDHDATAIAAHAADVLIARFGADDDERAELLNARIGLANLRGRYADGVALARSMLELAVHAHGTSHHMVMKARYLLAEELEFSGEFEAAFPIFRAALSDAEQLDGPEHPTVGVILNGLGGSLNDAARYAEARPLLERALDIQRRTQGPAHSEVGVVLVNLAEADFELGDLDIAERRAREALAIKERTLGSTHRGVAYPLQLLGRIELRTGRLDDALRDLRRALAIREAALGPAHPEVAESLMRLASVQMARRQWREASALATRAAAIFEQRGDNPVVLAESRLVLASALWVTGPDHRRAHQLAVAARDGAAAAGSRGRAVARDVESWLRDHPLP